MGEGVVVPINQSTNQPIDESTNLPTYQSTNGGGIVMGWLRFDQTEFYGLGTCLVVRTLRGKSLMLHAFPFMDLSRLDGISLWQGPPTLYL